MNKIDDYFQEVAYMMGYKPEDLLPVDRQAVMLQSAHLVKGMSEKQKQFYLNKKMVSLLQRQNKIFKAVQTEIKRRQFTYKLSADHKARIHNPAIVKILTDHEKLVNKNKRYLDNLFRKKTIDQSMELKRQFMTSQKYKRTQKSMRSNTSSVSNRSSRSNQSNRSSLYNQSNASHKQRLQVVREKEKDQLELRKAMLRHKQQKDSKKSLRASQNSSRRSQRVKTRTAVNKQVVDQNKKQLQSMKNAELKSHLEQLKYKMQKTELIRSKNQERKELRQRQTNYKQVKKMMDDENKKLLEYTYNQKLKSASIRFQNQNLIKSQARNFNRLTLNLKLDNAKKIRQSKNSQDNQFLNNVMKYQQFRMQTAQFKRKKLLDLEKQKAIKREIKKQMVKKNLQSYSNRRYQETQQVQRKISRKLESVEEIDRVKKQLSKEKQKIKQQTSFYRRSLEASPNRIKINSFFNL